MDLLKDLDLQLGSMCSLLLFGAFAKTFFQGRKWWCQEGFRHLKWWCLREVGKATWKIDSCSSLFMFLLSYH